MSTQTKGLAALLAAQGRNGDDELIHATKSELAALNRIKRGIDGKDLPRNPRTGLHEANFFRDWAPQLGMGLGAAAGIAAAPFTAGTSLALTPAMAAAIGGAAGGGLGSVARGDDTQSALINTAAGGLGGYGVGSMAAGLGAAGAAGASGASGTGVVAPAGTAALPATATAPAAEVAATGLPTSTSSALAGSGGGAAGETLSTTNVFSNSVKNGIQMYESGAGGSGLKIGADAGTGLKLGTGTTMAGTNTGTGLQATPEIAKTMGTGGSQGANWSYLGTKEALSDAIPVGMSMAAMTPGAADTGTTGDSYTGPRYRGEVYYTPYGERRTRAVPYAGGGEIYGDYDGVEDEHAGGGLMGYAGGGGIGFIRSMQPGGEWGDMTSDIYGAVQEHKPQWLQNIEPGGFLGATVPGKMDWEEKKRKEQEEKKRAEQELAAKQAAAKTATMASGGISSLGYYSDGGRMLRGPGDGVSDSIPASIEGKRPARLADGEFVIPARAVSELGNGSTEAGSKQLYAMLDRIAKKRKKGSGLAYQANPKKLMPV